MDSDYLHSAIEATNDGIVIADAQKEDQPIIYVNPAFERLTGYGREEVLGRNCRFLQGEDTQQRGLMELRKALREGRPCLVTLRNYRKDGTRFWNELSISLVKAKDGMLTHYVGIQKDVTERTRNRTRLKKYQERLRKANRRLRKLSTHDPLTRVHNRRHFASMYRRDWQIAARENEPLTVMMIDIDYFKQYNDTYGHQAGDRCLKRIASALKHSMRRASDLVARFGGEEFIVILQGLSAEKALPLAEAISRKIYDLHIPHKASEAAPYVTVSIGLASLTPIPGANRERLLMEADQALYQAKKQGRNTVVLQEN